MNFDSISIFGIFDWNYDDEISSFLVFTDGIKARNCEVERTINIDFVKAIRIESVIWSDIFFFFWHTKFLKFIFEFGEIFATECIFQELAFKTTTKIF